jgi:uncharacterized protein (DUF2336 family)
MADAQQSLIEEFEEAIAGKDHGDRADVLGRITALFAAGATSYNDEQVALFDDVMTRLVEQIDVTMRAAFGKTLAALPDAPPKTIRTLASDDSIAVAGPVLARSQRLDDAALVETASTKSQDHLLAISQRRELGAAVTDVLVERGNQQVALSTAKNPGATFSDAGYDRLVTRSKNDLELAASVWARPEIPRQHVLKLFADASAAVRIKLEAADPSKASQVRDMIARAAGQLQTATRQSVDYTSARAFVETLHKVGKLDEKQLRAFASSSMFDATVVALSLMCDLPIGLIEHILVEGKAERVLVLAKALGAGWDTAKALLALKAQTAGRSAQEIEQCAAQFAKLHPETAKKAVYYYRRRAEAAAPAT